MSKAQHICLLRPRFNYNTSVELFPLRHGYFVTSYQWESETELGRFVNEVSINYHNGSISPVPRLS